MRNAVLLSGSLGMGHDVLAEACTTSLTGAGWSADTLDAMRLLGKGGGSAGEAVFRSMLAVPGLYAPSTSPRCAPEAGWRCSPTRRPGGR